MRSDDEILADLRKCVGYYDRGLLSAVGVVDEVLVNLVLRHTPTDG